MTKADNKLVHCQECGRDICGPSRQSQTSTTSKIYNSDNTLVSKRCSKCNIVKDKSGFYVDHRTGCLQCWCKDCKKKYNLHWKKTPAGRAAASRYKNGSAGRAAAKRRLQSAEYVEYEKRRNRSPARMEGKKISKQGIRREALLIVGCGEIKCVACPVRDPSLLDINHLNGDGALDEKKYGVKGLEAAIVSGRRKIDDLDLRCKNCHWEYDRNRGEKNKVKNIPPRFSQQLPVQIQSESCKFRTVDSNKVEATHSTSRSLSAPVPMPSDNG